MLVHESLNFIAIDGCN